jgi:hypothetical protein
MFLHTLVCTMYANDFESLVARILDLKLLKTTPGARLIASTCILSIYRFIRSFTSVAILVTIYKAG